ncbi:serine hydrolase domain-containing protein [Myroides phaeus]|uniref:serine hydrolase domain-containing protein n=1 Tax=Myroides phaeus TaxID=702745 RepID=UPI001E65AF41|nr:serine hydrolase domain-containing protein [Myroides phaeus]
MMIKTNKLTISVLTALCFCACNNSNKSKDLAINTAINKEHNILVENPYTVEFEELSSSYIEKQRKEVEEFYHNNIKTGDYTGSFLVAKNGKIIYEDYSGVYDRTGKKKITSDTPLHVASVGKVITATTVLRLVDQGKISLDQSVSEIIPRFPYKEITVRTLLSHRSGLRYYGYYDNVWDRTKTISNSDVIKVIEEQTVALDFKPNTRFAYSNTNYVVLAEIVERVTQKPFKKAVAELIFEPLGMTHSFVFDDISNKNKVSQSFTSKMRLMDWDYMDGTYGDKNIFTTPRDFLKFDTAMYSDEFLSKKVKDQIYQGYSFENPGIRNYGLGIRLIEMQNGQFYTYHNGWWRGNTSSYIRLAKDNTCIILFSNKYSRTTYKTISLSHHFGDYPVGDIEL